MKQGKWAILFLFLGFLLFQACATRSPSPGNQRLVPLQEVNLDLVFEENEGLKVNFEDAKELRDFYRGGVQQKAKAEKLFKQKDYAEAIKLFQSSEEFFLTLLQHFDEDSAEYGLFLGTHILFFPNLLAADNHLKMGLIFRETGKESKARHAWKRALSFVTQSLKSERTEWGLALQQELQKLLTAKNG